MEINITSERENKLFHRKEIRFMATYPGSKTPTGEEMREEICKKLSLHPNMTIIIRIRQIFGSSSSEVEAHSYSKKETMEAFARKAKGQGSKDAKAPKAAAPAEAQKPEKKAQAEK